MSPPPDPRELRRLSLGASTVPENCERVSSETRPRGCLFSTVALEETVLDPESEVEASCSRLGEL